MLQIIKQIRKEGKTINIAEKYSEAYTLEGQLKCPNIISHIPKESITLNGKDLMSEIWNLSIPENSTVEIIIGIKES